MADRPVVPAPNTQPARLADAVALVWIRALLDMEGGMRWAAHPLSCVRTALAGETDPVQLGCDPDQRADALASGGDMEKFRAALAAREETP